MLPFRENWRQTQGFGVNPKAYAKFGLLGHNGIDYACPTGTTIVACDDGKIGLVANDPTGYGLYVKVIHSWGESLYAHLREALVAPGTPIKKGQAIAFSNNTGNSTGPHLHFGIRVNPYSKSDGYSGYSDPTPHYSHDIPNQGGFMEPSVLVRDVIKACWRSITGSEASDFDLKTELGKTPFVLEDLVRRLINGAGYVSEKDYATAIKEAFDQGYLKGKSEGVANPPPSGETGDGGATNPPPVPGNSSDPVDDGTASGLFTAIYLFLKKFFGRG